MINFSTQRAWDKNYLKKQVRQKQNVKLELRKEIIRLIDKVALLDPNSKPHYSYFILALYGINAV